MKKIFVIIIGVFLISCNNHVEKKHNILFISIDDLRPTMNSYNYENEKMITPYMDKLASEGVQFNNCLLYTSPSPRDAHESRMPSSA